MYYWVVLCGVGIGFLLIYVCVVGVLLVLFDIGIKFWCEIFLVYYFDVVCKVEVWVMFDWLCSVFDGYCYLWFVEDFIYFDKFELMLLVVDCE